LTGHRSFLPAHWPSRVDKGSLHDASLSRTSVPDSLAARNSSNAAASRGELPVQPVRVARPQGFDRVPGVGPPWSGAGGLDYALRRN
jgi:hypothetical protein